MENKPGQHIFNVGNKETVTIREWVELCYQIARKQVEFIHVHEDIEQRNYFPFYKYEYCLDVSKQYELMQNVNNGTVEKIEINGLIRVLTNKKTRSEIFGF